MKKITSPSKKINPYTWRSIKSVRIKSCIPGECNLSAANFVRKIRTNPGFYDDQTILARDILLELCATHTGTVPRVARRILERAGFTKRIIPKEAYAKNPTDNYILKDWQVNRAGFIASIEFVKNRIEPLFDNKKIDDEDAIKEAFKLIVRRDMTEEEMRELRKKAHESLPELAIFLEVSELNSFLNKEKISPLSYDTVRDYYYNTRLRRSRKGKIHYRDTMERYYPLGFGKTPEKPLPDFLGFLEGIFWSKKPR